MISHGSRRSPFLFAIDDDERSKRSFALSNVGRINGAFVWCWFVRKYSGIYIYIYVLMSVVGDENIIAIGPVVVLVEYATPNYNK